jgi:hypothetical protein
MEFCQQEAIKTLKKLPKTIKVYAFRWQKRLKRVLKETKKRIT